MSKLQASFRNSIVNVQRCLALTLIEGASRDTVKECSVEALPEACFMSSHISVISLNDKADFSLLPPLAKHVVLTMLYNPDPVSIVDFNAWFGTDSASKS
jgi:hypothetical protein